MMNAAAKPIDTDSGKANAVAVHRHGLSQQAGKKSGITAFTHALAMHPAINKQRLVVQKEAEPPHVSLASHYHRVITGEVLSAIAGQHCG